MTTVDYESIWQGVWGDMQKYGPVHRHHRRLFVEMFREIPTDEIATIADMGCGEGSNLAFLGTRFPQAKLYGFDISRTAIEAASKYVDAQFGILDFQKDIAPEQFDVVVSSDVVEHLPNDAAAIKNMRRMARRYVLIATVQGRMRKNEASIGHLRNYAPGELQEKMQAAGLRIIKVIQWGFPFYSPIFRDLLALFPASAEFSYGKYGPIQKLTSSMLYALFSLNRSDKGDVIFVLAHA
jgi:trans-aconitate methyltransferase